MDARSEAAARAASVYNAASDHFDDPALGFWERFGQLSVARAALPVGAHVLDVCCGTGASALAAARAVGPSGRVIAIDVAERLLAVAREKAVAAGLTNVELRCADATSTGLPDAAFDAVVCVFGVFFAPDRAAFVREMWRQVTPGGTLVVTTWGPGLFEPASTVFWDEVRRVRPELDRAFDPWDDLVTPDAVVALLQSGGVVGATAEAVPAEHALAEPGDFWHVVLGSGYRATVDALTADERERVRVAVLGELTRRGTTTLTTGVVIGRAVRPR